MRLGTIPASLVLLVACGGEPSATAPTPAPMPVPVEGPPAAPAPAATGAPEPATVGVAPPASTPPPSGPTPPDLRSDALELAEARRLSNAHDYTGAAAIFDRLLERSPRAPRLACEAGYVNFLKGDLERAATLLDVGLRSFELLRWSDTYDPPRAMCLYNRGLVHERRGETEAARVDFTTSLALRPNAGVEAALTRIGGPLAAPDRADTPGTVPAELHGPSIASIFAAHASSVCAAVGATTTSPLIDATTGCTTGTSELGAPGAAVIWFRGLGSDRFGTISDGVTAWYLALDGSGETVALGPIATDESVTWNYQRFVLERVERTGDHALADATLTEFLTDSGCSDSYTERIVVACARTAGVWRCAWLGAGNTGSSSCISDDGDPGPERSHTSPDYGTPVRWEEDELVRGDRRWAFDALAGRCADPAHRCPETVWAAP